MYHINIASQKVQKLENRRENTYFHYSNKTITMILDFFFYLPRVYFLHSFKSQLKIGIQLKFLIYLIFLLLNMLIFSYYSLL